jgi:hypothetical protein
VGEVHRSRHQVICFAQYEAAAVRLIALRTDR